MKINKRLLKELAWDGGVRPGDGRNTKAKRRELQQTRDIARRAQRKRLERWLDQQLKDELESDE